MDNIARIHIYIAFFLIIVGINVVSSDEDVRRPVIYTRSSFISQNFLSSKSNTRPTFEEYLKNRSQMLNEEASQAIGANINLNERENKANEIIMRIKRAEVIDGFNKPSTFAPSRHLFTVLEQIKNSTLFKLIRKMPKGGVLHGHDTALCSSQCVMNLTYRKDLWQCYSETKKNLHLKFSKIQPISIENDCYWKLVSEERREKGTTVYDNEIKKFFTLYEKNPQESYKDINEVWGKFVNIFVTVEPLLTYKPIWKEYFWNTLKEFYDDNVQYLEFRGTLPQLYDFNGTQYTNEDVVQIYVDTLNEFKQQYPDFIGAKFIYAPIRTVDDFEFSDYLKTILKLKEQFPNFIAGFDLVGQEDTGRPLIDFAKGLLGLPEDIKFFFHAGETNWYGTTTDENLIDAILLGTKRIGHGYAVVKHPSVLKAIKEKNIAIEVNPISNQVLKLNDDNRNHPSSYLFANNYPLVISSDDPSFWETTPLSHDFYIAFLGIASAHADLKTLKQLAQNSITYSSLNEAEKQGAFEKWEKKWNDFIELIIHTNGTVNGIK